MRVRLEVVEDALALQILDDAIGNVVRVLARQPAKAVEVAPELVERRDDRQPDVLAQVIVLGAGTWRDVDDARALVLGDVVPGNDAMLVARVTECLLNEVQLVERSAIPPADQL